ncbi:histidine kinase [Paenibacillus sp. S3N08]|uniref:histidine kinase n=1 Tax=Paenibacillus agricola TaxID=2716264 RepID=A0ABX0J6G7_9BACL|nr:histidine kinase [Paenibacillus agricola]
MNGWEAVQGVQDLTGWEFDSKNVVALNGEWNLYWSQLLDPTQIAQNRQEAGSHRWIQFPIVWKQQELGGILLSGTGYATMHLEVKLQPSSRVLALELPLIRTAYALWINGKPVANVGTVGTDRDSSNPAKLPQLILFPQADAAKLDIVLQVSNFHHKFGGVSNELILGNAEEMVSRHDKRMGLDMLLVGSLLLMGCYNLGLFLIRIREKTSLYLSLYCFLIGIRAMLVGEGSMFMLFPRLEWLTSLRIEYICFYMSMATVFIFCRVLYPGQTSVRMVHIAGWSFTACSLSTLILPPWIFTAMLQVYLLITTFVWGYAGLVLIKARLAKKEGSLFLLMGILVYGIAVGIDIANNNQWIYMQGVSSIGQFYAIFMASFIVSVKSFKAFSSVEILSRQLRDLNIGLESRIQERTAELEETNHALEKINDDLERLETSRRHLLSNISHDLGTPMTLIQGYIEALIDKVVVGPEQQDKYLRLVLNRINGLNRLIADLFHLSKLEARQIDFSMQELTVDQFIECFSERYVVEVNNAGIHFNMITLLPEQNGRSLQRLIIDINRIDQVFTNIVFNAIKHTPRGGSIQLGLEADEHSIQLKVQDTGVGIAPEDLPFIFDRFYKKDKSRNSAAGGSGLGLSIAKEIVEFHGGRIWAESTLGKGASIYFELPFNEAGRYSDVSSSPIQ